MCELVDTFPAFLAYWARAQGQTLDDQISGWATEYLAPWPELLSLQIDNYASQAADWRQVAREKVFPYLDERLPAMQKAHDNLLRLLLPAYSRAQQALGFESEAVFVLHVGIGCGAGWVNPYCGSPAILFGLENIAECGWSDAGTLAGLTAHEIGHLAHHHWRAEHAMPVGSGPWWQIYEEGFAEQCERLVLQADLTHRAGQHRGDDWLGWCRGRQDWLAAEFLRTVEAGEPVTPFFGSWFDICGRSETGYYLGWQVVQELERNLSLIEIALLDKVESYARPIIERMARRGG